MLSDKYLLVKFLSGQIIDYVFLIYELFYNIIKNNAISNIEQDFDLLNNTNSMNYFENLSLLNNFEEDTKNEKIKLIKSVFGNIVEENQTEKIFFILTEKINCSMLSDKYLLVKFLSGQKKYFLF